MNQVEKERYPKDGWNYYVNDDYYYNIVNTIIAIRDLLGGSGFTFPAMKELGVNT
jgi:hypothetical protein